MNSHIIILFIFIIILVNLFFYNIVKNVNAVIKYCNKIPPSDHSEAVTIIKPSKGSNEFTYSNYNSWINQNNQTESNIQYILSFDEENDEGIKIANKIQYKNKKILVNPIINGFSGKMSALYHGLYNSTNELIIFSDGDTKAKNDTISKIQSQLKNNAKIVTCLAIYNKATNIWARLYASTWNLTELGIVGYSILTKGDQVVGNTFALHKNTLEQIGGLENYKNYIAEDIAIGKKAYELNQTILLGPLIESPVGALSYSNLIDKYSRAAQYTIKMRGLTKSWHFILLYSYFLVLLPPSIFLGKEILLLSLFLAMGRLALASYLWFITTNERRIFLECFIGDIIFFTVYIKSLFSKKITWSNNKYKVDSHGKLIRING